MARGHTQDQLAETSKVSQGTISALENGLVPNPQVDTLERLAIALGSDLTTVITAVRSSVAEAA